MGQDGTHGVQCPLKNPHQRQETLPIRTKTPHQRRKRLPIRTKTPHQRLAQRLAHKDENSTPKTSPKTSPKASKKAIGKTAQAIFGSTLLWEESSITLQICRKADISSVSKAERLAVGKS